MYQALASEVGLLSEYLHRFKFTTNDEGHNTQSRSLDGVCLIHPRQMEFICIQEADITRVLNRWSELETMGLSTLAVWSNHCALQALTDEI